MKNDSNEKTMKYAQSCDSDKCRERYKNDRLFADECPTTAHEIIFTTKEKMCLLCGKTTKFKG